jgi:hypothetical protein
MQLVIQHRKTADGNGEDVRKFLKPAFDPRLAVLVFVPEQKRPAEAAGDAVIPASDGGVDEVGASDRHGRIWVRPAQANQSESRRQDRSARPFFLGFLGSAGDLRVVHFQRVPLFGRNPSQ